MKIIILFSLIAFCKADDYYWRQYNGTIPHDAVPGGTDDDGEPTFIGTTFFSSNHALLPSIINVNNTFAHSHLGPYFLRTHINTKILCASENDKPIWKKVRFDEIYKDKTCSFINGGYHNNAPLLIGRKQFDGKYITGKVFPSDHEWYGLEVWRRGHIGHIEEFEVIGYCSDS